MMSAVEEGGPCTVAGMPASRPDLRTSEDSPSEPEAARPRLVFAARRAPYPLENGARIRTHHLLTGLAEAFETVLVTFEHHPDSPDGLCRKDELERLYPSIDVITVPGNGAAKRANQALGMLRRRSWAWGRYRSRAFAEAVRGAADSRRASIVHFDDLGVALAGPVAGASSVYSSHNVEQRIPLLSARAGSPLRRIFYRVEALKIRAEERRVWRSMDLSLAVSPLDGRAMRAGGARRIELCPNGAPVVERIPVQPRSPDEPLNLLFVGTGSYAPYERGLAWFVRDALPRIQARTPAALEVVGDPPAHPVDARGVRYVGRVPAVEPFYAASHGVVVPVFEGSGTRLKILEAMAYGRPVISTGLGAEGLPVTAGEHFLRADRADEFAAAGARLAEWSLRREDGEIDRMIDSAREAVQPLFWPGVARQLVELYRSELARLSP
jgi:glycosyltransferase involved in cell wall biosynthesis